MSTVLISHMGGCFTCNNSEAVWFARNAQALAAQHHQRTGHPTWFEGVISSRYGETPSTLPMEPKCS